MTAVDLLRAIGLLLGAWVAVSFLLGALWIVYATGRHRWEGR